jgi:N-acetyl sugar amidotransferase
MNTGPRLCARCVLDTSARDITFDDEGNCNYCSTFLSRSADILNRSPAEKRENLDRLVGRIKRLGAGKRYNCVVGVSGGVDSSWALVRAVKEGLRPLAVHMDNGWNSELAQNNISNLVRALDVDLVTHVIDWNEYRGLMQAFLAADVIDVELLYDNAMLAVNYRQAAQHGVKAILAGTNQATEGMRTPRGWNWFKYDKRNIKRLSKAFGNIRIKTFPAIGTLDYVWFEFIRRIRWISFLDYFDYNKAEVLKILQTDYDYKPYPYKHYESIFTRFYQGYILPAKFGIDKRRLHLSALVVTGQMTRDEALADLENIPYESERDLEADKSYFLKKMRWTAADLDEYISRPEKPHSSYGTERALWDFLSRFYFATFGRYAR